MISFAKENPNRWYELAWWLCVVTLPLPISVSNGAIILLGLVWLSQGSLFKNVKELKKSKWAWPFLFYYLWLWIGLIYTQDISGTLFSVEKEISFLALPVIAATGQNLDERFISFLKMSFVYACLVIVVICFSASIYNFIIGNDTPNFDFNTYSDFLKIHPDASPIWSKISYVQLVQWMDLHPTYFSMYLIFCLVILFTERPGTQWELIVSILIGAIIGIFVALLSSRIAIVALLISFGFLIVVGFIKKEIRFGVPIILIAILVLCFVWLNPVSRFRLMEETAQTSYKIDKTTTHWNSVNYRLLEWEVSWSVIKNDLLLGVGPGAWQSSMKYFFSQFDEQMKDLHYNAHNQYLQTWMEGGVLGLLLFLACLAMPFFQSIITPAQVCFLLIFSIICLTESVGESQKGIVFFTLFQVLFLAFQSKK